jgi:acyl-coenzyme A thioesterase PaaI-like protein
MNTVTELPFNKLLSLQPADAAHLLRLPAGGQYLNHLGTVHAGALLSLAEASSGEFLLRTIGDAAGIVPVVRRLEAKFRKPANGAVTSTASVAAGAMDELRTALAARGRALISVDVELHDESGAHVLSASVEWFVATAPARL